VFVDLEADRGPRLDPDVFPGHKKLEPGSHVDLSRQHDPEAVDLLPACIVFVSIV
jgi:hypothetical protein